MCVGYVHSPSPISQNVLIFILAAILRSQPLLCLKINSANLLRASLFHSGKKLHSGPWLLHRPRENRQQCSGRKLPHNRICGLTKLSISASKDEVFNPYLSIDHYFKIYVMYFEEIEALQNAEIAPL